MPVAQVIVDVPTRALDRPLDYLIPERLGDIVAVGVPVLVPLGSRDVVGYVASTAASSEIARLKPIISVLGEALFDEVRADLAGWMSERYLCPLSEALRLMLPPGGTPRVVRSAQGEWTLANPTVGAVDEKWAEAAPDADPTLIRQGAVRQRAVFDALTGGPVAVSELRAQLGDVGGVVDRLADLGLVRVESRRRWRMPQTPDRRSEVHDRLTDEQVAAGHAISSVDPGGCVLIDGVTGSGKTEVYLQAIEGELERGRGAIVLVPEISLTPQTVGRFRARFGEDVAVLHSRLSAGERFDQWERVRSGAASVVIGPRSALFAPMAELGLIVIDEEHESSYKQGSSPRYHAREVAERLAGSTGAKLVLGSATPSLESQSMAADGRCVRVRMEARATGASLPTVQIVDMAREFANGNRSMFSVSLRDALASVARREEKAVLLLNRRGFASFLLCRECGFVPECDDCSVSLTYHEAGGRLTCHHCAAVRAVPAACPECGSPYLRKFGAGTQRVEAELAQAFPELPVVRMDADTTSRKGGHQTRLAEFEQLRAGVLLGTQMIAKGLDYPEVTLVGVLGADLGLWMPDFRSAERTFQLLTQVSGRAGRGDRPGLVVIQTYAPDHPAVLAAATGDRDAFYHSERETRSAHGYPPYGSLARVLVSGADLEDVRAAATGLARELRAGADQGVVLGPAEAPLARVRGVHRWHVLVKGSSDAALSSWVGGALSRSPDPPRGVTRAPDIGPYDLL